MAQSVQISCINKLPRTDAHERIKSIGGVNENKTRWKLDLDAAIAGVESGKWEFWTAGGGKSVWVIVASHSGHKYLKTVADGVQPDNLLALPECP
jgi:Protein of unknown function (DUF3892)